ncbi:hypothetical protein GUJ93_ZPchr0011g28224 [Zizania palustris]|uniref:Uncharacterized protein n=1 Tax=Zizania palustris TaxID=103762 RepID=A0A8J5WIJ6_ZIZPA|nr:hypothetical protein GUJ93_ZPchr0011g28224 [Zizania palustris]
MWVKDRVCSPNGCRGEDDHDIIPKEELDDGKGGTNMFVIGDPQGIFERHVAINVHEHLFPTETRLP